MKKKIKPRNLHAKALREIKPQRVASKKIYKRVKPKAFHANDNPYGK